MKSIVAEFGSGFALLPRDVLDGELIESPLCLSTGRAIVSPKATNVSIGPQIVGGVGGTHRCSLADFEPRER